MSQGSDELKQQVVDLLNDASSRSVTADDIWVRRESDGTIRYGAVTEAGRQALLHYEAYREG